MSTLHDFETTRACFGRNYFTILQFSGGNGCTKRAYSTTQNVIMNRLTSEDDETTDFSCDHVRNKSMVSYLFTKLTNWRLMETIEVRRLYARKGTIKIENVIKVNVYEYITY